MAESKRMTQTQLVRTIADACEVPSKTAKQALACLSDVALREAKRNGVFVLPGLGRICLLYTSRCV